MTNWYKKVGLSLLAFGLTSTASLSAVGCGPSCDPCDTCDPCCFGGFGIEVDFLWWKPCVDDLDYAAALTTTTENAVTTSKYKYKELCPEWEPGVRVSLSMPSCFCDGDFSATWNYLDICDSNTYPAGDGETLVSPVLHHELVSALSTWTRAKVSYDFKYNDWNVLMTYGLCDSGCNSFTTHVGVAGVYFDQEMSVTLDTPDSSTANTSDTKWTSEYWGVGLEFGGGWECNFCDCMHMYAKGSGLLLAGEDCNKFTQNVVDNSSSTAVTTAVEFTDNDCCHFLPGYKIEAGFVYDTCVCDCDFYVKVGYSFTGWYNLPKHRHFPGDDSVAGDDSTSTANYGRTLGLHGLVAGLGVNF